MAHPPRLWRNMAVYLRLPEHLAHQWWQALSRAPWCEACALRQTFLLHDAVPHLGTTALAHATASPASLAKILGNLITEGVLTFEKANAILAYVLACTDREGQWIQHTA